MARSSGELAAAWSSAMVPQAASSTGSWLMNTGLLPAPAAAPPPLLLLLPALSVMASLAYASSSACTGCGTNARQSSSRLNTSAKLKSAVGDVDDDVLLLLPSKGWVRRWRNSVMASAFDSRAGQRSVAAGASAMVDRLDVGHLLRRGGMRVPRIGVTSRSSKGGSKH